MDVSCTVFEKLTHNAIENSVFQRDPRLEEPARISGWNLSSKN